MPGVAAGVSLPGSGAERTECKLHAEVMGAKGYGPVAQLG